jgi:hypothetical protein
MKDKLNSIQNNKLLLEQKIGEYESMLTKLAQQEQTGTESKKTEQSPWVESEPEEFMMKTLTEQESEAPPTPRNPMTCLSTNNNSP